ncbi:putative metallopeptidase [Sinorhizobium meliloti]|uniref:putative metallopeptidase n=2 Tax=Rhizobium meliloti TaxID=382 RepID=UPI002E11081D|nr:putative metallopeptidase [Sinorhizobium meliloti]WQO38605.1 putative metallopeptidase [Sinorhizobium meliloti]WQO79057.1 putative metallopeptidase [Sinorhizobium meliloti]
MRSIRQCGKAHLVRCCSFPRASSLPAPIQKYGESDVSSPIRPAAELGFLWTVVENSRKGRRIIGHCEEETSGRHGKWARAQAEMQVKQWFGFVPDFIITLDAEYCRACGAPVFTIRGHNVEEFVGVVRRYGADAAGVRAIVDAAPARQR